MRSTPISAGLTSLATHLLNGPTRAILTQLKGNQSTLMLMMSPMKPKRPTMTDNLRTINDVMSVI